MPGGHDNRTFRGGDREAAAAFVAASGLDEDTWDRAAGWAPWTALITVDDPGSATTLARLREDRPDP